MCGRRTKYLCQIAVEVFCYRPLKREQRSETDPNYNAEANIGALGSGSDFTPFLQHLGVASTDMGFGGDYGVYHSAYDSFFWMSHFGDPTFVYHVAAAQLWGTIAMRLADADGLPFDYTYYASQIRDFFNETVRIAKRYKLDSAFDEQTMNEALKDFAEAAVRAQNSRQEAVTEMGKTRSATAKLQRINDVLIATEREFIDPRGLRGRAWYKHEIYAPGIYTGYAAQPLTDFRQALDDRNSANTKEALNRIVEALRRATQSLAKASD